MQLDTSQASTLLLFGDQTDGFFAPIKQLYEQAATDPLLAKFLQDSSVMLRRELSSLEPRMRDAMGGSFSDLLQLAERFRHKDDAVGLAHAILVGIVRAAKLVEFAQAYPALLDAKGPSKHLLGACGGLLAASAMLIAEDIQSLYQASLEMIKVTCRLSNLMINRSWAVEDTIDSWGWSIIGVSARDLQEYLDSFHSTHRISPHRRVKIGASDVDDGWHTVIGPPSVLRVFLSACAPVKTLPRQKLRISSLTHALDSLDDEEVNYVLGESPLLDAHVLPQYVLLSLGNTAEYKCTLWRDILSQVVRDIGTKPLLLRQGLQALEGLLGPVKAVNLNVMGPTSHLSIVSGYLEECGRTVSVIHKPTSGLQEVNEPDYSGRIAIVGMSGRYPASDDLNEFWNIIAEGKIVHGEIPPDRFDLEELYDPKAGKHMSTATKYGCFIREPGLFDARFFNVSPREALQIDPGHRLFLMSAYEALEMAGYSRGRFGAPDDSRVATFLGQATEDWRDIMHISGGDAFSLGGLQRSFGPGRLNFSMRWSGPTYSVDSACASGLSSVTLACSSLLARECDMAVAGGANVVASPLTYHVLSKAGFLSTTGGCKTYRADADGYCRGEFVGAFVLKRLEDAVADKDNILSVIAASARNHSGHASSIMHSDHRAQESLMGEVLRKAGVDASDVSYVEMHGTGTQVGDFAEMTAVANTFGATGQGASQGASRRGGPLMVGAVKANIGHAEAGAGSAALLKAVLMIQTNTIPPQAGLPNRINDKLPDLERLDIEIPTQLGPFESRVGGTRSVLINSFDASGGNTCVLIQEPPSSHAAVSSAGPDPRSRHVVVTSARTAGAHAANKRRLLAFLQANPSTALADLAYTTTARRLHYPLRSAWAVESVADLIGQLQAEAATATAPPHPPPGGTGATPAPVVFVFTGQGAAYGGMGSQLFATNPAFRNKAKLCARLAASFALPPFLHLLTDSGCNESTQTAAQVQLAVVTLEVALAAFWASCGIKPAMVTGHSLGEYAALHVAGVLSLADMLFLVGRRAQLIEERCEAGTYSMLALATDDREAARLLSAAPHSTTRCTLACLNSPLATVMSGPVDDIAELQQHIRAQKLRCLVLPLAYGFHSAQLDPILHEYTQIAQTVTYQPPAIPVASTLLGELVATEGVFGAPYLARQAREPVNFVNAIRAMCDKVQRQGSLWLELGPTSLCIDMVRATMPPSLSIALAPSLIRGASAWTTAAAALALAYQARVDIDWAQFHEPYAKHVRLLALPSYAFDTKNYWRVYKTPAASAPSSALVPGAAPSTTTLHHLVSESYGPPEAKATFESFLSESGLAALVKGHRLHGVAISPGAVFVDMALTAARYLSQRLAGDKGLAATFNSLRDCVFLRPIILDESAEKQSIQLSVSRSGHASTSNGVSSSLFTRSPKGAKVEYAKCVVVQTDAAAVTAGWSKIGPAIRARCLQVSQAARDGAGHRLSPPLFYALFSQIVDYSNDYRRISQVSISEDFDEAYAEVLLQPSPKGTSFALSPYWGDSVVHLAGFLVNCNPKKPIGELAMLQSFGACDVLEPMSAGKPYRVYARVGKPAKGSTPVDVYVFDDGERLVMQYSDLRFHQVPTANFMRMLGKRDIGGNHPVAAQQHTTIPAPSFESKHLLHPRPASTSSSNVSMPSNSSASSMSSKRPTPSTYACTPAPSPSPTGPPLNNTGPTKEQIVIIILEAVAENTGYDVSALAPNSVLSDLGVDSIMAIQLAMHLQEKLEIEFEASLFHEHPTIGGVAQAFSSQMSSELATQSKLESAHHQQPFEGYSLVADPLTERSERSEQSEPVSMVSNNSQTNLLTAVLEALATETGVDAEELDGSTLLSDLGVDSIMAIQIATAVQNATGIEIGATSLHDYPTVEELRRAFSDSAAVSGSNLAEIANSPYPEELPSSQSSWEDLEESLAPRTAQQVYSEDYGAPSTDVSRTTSLHDLSPQRTGMSPETIISNASVVQLTVQAPSSTGLAEKSHSSSRDPANALAPRSMSEPHVNIVLMHGRLSSDLTPLFMFPDGTGAAATYIYLKRLGNNRPVYAVESPFLRCPEQFTCGAEQVASLMAEAISKQHKGPYLLAGYSGGSILAYEAARQLLLADHEVQGLLLFDMAAPKIRPDKHEEAMPKVLVEMMVRLMGGSRNIWLDQTAASKSQLHMRHMVRCVSTYGGKAMPSDRRPTRTVMTWCTRGVAERLDEPFKQKLAANGVSCDPVPNFMEDPDVGPFNWTFPPNKPLGPNGWDQMVGPIHCLAIDADHFSMIVPPDVHKFRDALEEGLAYCTEGKA